MPLVSVTIPCYPHVKCIIIIIIIITIMHMHMHVHMHAHMRMCARARICALHIWYLKFCQWFIFTAQLSWPSPSAVNSTLASGTSFHFSSRSCITISDGCHPCCHSTTSLFSEEIFPYLRCVSSNTVPFGWFTRVGVVSAPKESARY